MGKEKSDLMNGALVLLNRSSKSMAKQGARVANITTQKKTHGLHSEVAGTGELESDERQQAHVPSTKMEKNKRK